MSTTATGRLEAIWVKRAHRGQMDAVESAVMVAGCGIEGNADQGGRRQVTLLSADQWAKAVGDAVDPKTRRANLLVSGLDLRHTRDCTVSIGEVELLVTGELVPCKLMDDLHPGLQELLRPDWAGGIHTQVLTSGVIKIGAEVRLASPPS